MSDQEKLFKRIRKRFKDRPKKWASGYLHGILDEAKREKPDRAYLGMTRHEYNSGYIYGFIDARGIDVKQDAWYQRLVDKLGHKIEFQWYLK